METFLGLDFQTWWFLLIGALFSGYAILDGFDLGVGTIHLFLKKEESRRIAINAIGPVWDGNEVWIVIGGGALFAAFPVVYANLFSAFYIPFYVFLFGIIFRAVSIEFRSKEPMPWWRLFWDISFSVSSTLIAFLLGVVLGNVIQGIPLDSRFEFHSSFLSFVNFYSVLVGLTTVALFTMHGALYLAMKTEGRLFAKMTFVVKNTTIFFVVCYVTTTVYTLIYIPHMTEEFRNAPVLFFIPLISILAIANITRQVANRKYKFAFISSGMVTSLLLILVAISLYPNMILSTIDPANNLNIYNSSSSVKSLKIMLIIAFIGIPIAFSYTVFIFRTFRGKVKLDETSY